MLRLAVTSKRSPIARMSLRDEWRLGFRMSLVCRSRAAKYAATSSSSEGIPSGTDSQRPNISTWRNDSAADVDPTVAVVGGSKNATSHTCKDVTGGVDCDGVHIVCRKAAIFFRPNILASFAGTYSQISEGGGMFRSTEPLVELIAAWGNAIVAECDEIA